MKVPRLRIAWVMVAIAIAALDFAAIRASLDIPEVGLLVLGALPMANVLAVGILVGQQRPGSRPFLLGFEVFGAMALAVYVILATYLRHEAVEPYLGLFIPIVEIIGPLPFIPIPIQVSVVVIALGLPQVAFALIGGFLSRKNRITTPNGQHQLPADW